MRIELTTLIDQLISDRYPETLDDDLPDLLSDGDKRDEAIEQLMKMIEFYKEDL